MSELGPYFSQSMASDQGTKGPTQVHVLTSVQQMRRPSLRKRIDTQTIQAKAYHASSKDVHIVVLLCRWSCKHLPPISRAFHIMGHHVC
jgi:hypothetical protein